MSFHTIRLLEVDADPRCHQQRLSWTIPANYEFSFLAQPEPPHQEGRTAITFNPGMELVQLREESPF